MVNAWQWLEGNFGLNLTLFGLFGFLWLEAFVLWIPEHLLEGLVSSLLDLSDFVRKVVLERLEVIIRYLLIFRFRQLLRLFLNGLSDCLKHL